MQNSEETIFSVICSGSFVLTQKTEFGGDYHMIEHSENINFTLSWGPIWAAQILK